MRCRILFFFAIIIVNHCFGMDLPQQQIIFLNGTTTAGKTSIALRLKEQLDAQSLSVEVLAIDTFLVPKIQWALAVNRLNPFNFGVANIDLITPSDIKNMCKESQKELCTAAITAYNQGKMVIIDAPAYSSDQIHSYQQALSGLKVTWSLVYCPISTLVKRIIGRNETSGITGQRSVLQALHQFYQLYTSNTIDSIDTLLKNDLCETCHEAQRQHVIMQNKIPDFLKGIQNAICPLNFDSIQKLMLEKFSLSENVKIGIAPVVRHDCIVNTDENNSVVCAEMIMRAVQANDKPKDHNTM